MLFDNCLEIGVIIKTNGVNGEVLVQSSFELKENYKLKESVFFEIEGLLVPFFVEYFNVIRNDCLLLKVKGINNKNKAITFTNCKVFIESNQKKQPRFIKNNLVGYKVYNQDDVFIGEVTSYIDIPENFLICVNYKTKEVLLPFNNELIINITENEVKLKIFNDLLKI